MPASALPDGRPQVPAVVRDVAAPSAEHCPESPDERRAETGRPARQAVPKRPVSLRGAQRFWPWAPRVHLSRAQQDVAMRRRDEYQALPVESLATPPVVRRGLPREAPQHGVHRLPPPDVAAQEPPAGERPEAPCAALRAQATRVRARKPSARDGLLRDGHDCRGARGGLQARGGRRYSGPPVPWPDRRCSCSSRSPASPTARKKITQLRRPIIRRNPKNPSILRELTRGPNNLPIAMRVVVVAVSVRPLRCRPSFERHGGCRVNRTSRHCVVLGLANRCPKATRIAVYRPAVG